MSFKLGSRSRKNLEGVHPDLVRFVKAAITHAPIDFTVIEEVRTEQRQPETLRISQTLSTACGFPRIL